jgi:hypothetical protein
LSGRRDGEEAEAGGAEKLQSILRALWLQSRQGTTRAPEAEGEEGMSNLALVAEARCSEPMSSWPQHNDFHRRNFHVFSGSRHGEMLWDEECLRCQLERAAEKQAINEKLQREGKE